MWGGIGRCCLPFTFYTSLAFASRITTRGESLQIRHCWPKCSRIRQKKTKKPLRDSTQLLVGNFYLTRENCHQDGSPRAESHEHGCSVCELLLNGEKQWEVEHGGIVVCEERHVGDVEDGVNEKAGRACGLEDLDRGWRY